MSNVFGHVRPVTREVGGKIYTYRSRLEYRWAVWCELRTMQGILRDWWFEDEETLLQIETPYFQNKKLYLPDFIVQLPNGEYEFEETKGYFPPKDATKIKLAAQQQDKPITLIFARLISNSRNASKREQYRRAKHLEPHVKRVIYDADKSIFEPIRGMFDL